ncbi:MAG: GH25 family lysozyme [Lachnospiraceae bacterium]
MKQNKTRTFVRVLAVFLILALVCPLIPMHSQAAVNGGQAGAVGIDVSKYQGNVDWAAVKASGVSFAFIKAYSSYSGIDPYFAQNVNGANAVGIRTGVYVYSYATSVEAAINEANILISIMQNYSITYPVAIDIEDDCQKNLDPNTLAAIANAFCATVANAGYQPLVYANKYWFTKRIAPIGYDHWVAQYASACDYPQVPAFWQASCTGRIPGIAGDVDIDYQYKDYSYIIPYGFSVRDGAVYFYNNYRWQKGWIDYNGLRYYCGVNGVVQTGWLQMPEGIYYLDPTGYMHTGFTEVAGKIYYLGTDGLLQMGLLNIGDANYYFGTDGSMYTGWLPLADGNRYYFGPDGKMQFGWLILDGKTYYFGEDGFMKIGLQQIGDKTYFFNGEGEMQYGWLDFGEFKLYAGADGALLHGLAAIDGSLYYFNPENGMMHQGWLILDGNTFFFEPGTGKMYFGLQVIGDQIYYFNPESGARMTGLVPTPTGVMYFEPATGARVAGWCVVNNMTMYFDPLTGVIATGFVTIGDNNFLFDGNGQLFKGLFGDNVGIRYYDETDGHQVLGFAFVNDILYYFDPANGGYMVANTVIDAGANGIYQFNELGQGVRIQ